MEFRSGWGTKTKKERIREQLQEEISNLQLSVTNQERHILLPKTIMDSDLIEIRALKKKLESDDKELQRLKRKLEKLDDKCK